MLVSDRGRTGVVVAWTVALWSSVAIAGTPAAPPPAKRTSGLEALLHDLKTNPLGSFYLQLRPRYEYADIEGSRVSHAATLRSVVGFGSRTWRGLSFVVEGEAIAALDTDWYFDGTGSGDEDRRSLVPDPTDIGLNQGYLHYEHAGWTTNLRLGRQRLILDDARFIGNVGWRQNEQTFDAILVTSGLGRTDVQITYAFLARALRIFGDKSPSRNRDFDSESHLLNLRWTGLSWLQPTLFAYRLDFENSPGDSSNSYGSRVTGSFERGPFSLDYSLSYALQTDAAGNPVDYRAHYAWARVAVGHERIGELAAGFERLGSDGGDAVFGTPLGTLHNFNGFADVFLDNGGPDGLRDLFVQARPLLPWRLDGEVALHRFWSDAGGRGLGWELDAVLARPLGRFVTLLAKAAYFDSLDASREDTLRVWLQLTFEL